MNIFKRKTKLEVFKIAIKHNSIWKIISTIIVAISGILMIPILFVVFKYLPTTYYVDLCNDFLYSSQVRSEKYEYF